MPDNALPPATKPCYVIFKYPLNESKVYVPDEFQILSIQIQNGNICAWILVNKNAETTTLKFTVTDTGQYLDQEFLKQHIYVSTVQEPLNVWHVFLQQELELRKLVRTI